MMKIVAIDPGQRGAVALYQRTDALPIVTVKRLPFAGRELDVLGLQEMIVSPLEAGVDLVQLPDLAILEKVHSMPGQGVASMFRFGETYGQIKAVLMMLEIPLELVPPKQWKRVLNGTKKDKAAAVAYCKRVFPGVSLLATARSVKPDDGMAEALCMLEYGRRLRLPVEED